jgi:hypothetical protein
MSKFKWLIQGENMFPTTSFFSLPGCINKNPIVWQDGARAIQKIRLQAYKN